MPRTLLEHLDPALGPKRILSLDGGGLRGVMTVGFLREIENLLRARHGGDPAFRLCDYFDLIAGTSTGAIIAGGLAMGLSVDECYDHYLRLGNVVFKKNLLRPGAIRAKYDADKVRKALQGIFGNRTLGSSDLRTGLLIVTKRLDTGSPWPLTNHPRSRYFTRGTQATTIANGEYPLWQVVRASTAAPHYFDAETVNIGRAAAGIKAVAGDFVDGGVSPANNPALQALMTATIEGHAFGWKTGPDQLLVVSCGTGRASAEMGRANLITSTALVNAVRSLASLMDDCADLVETVMQWLSVSPTARSIDRVLGTCTPPFGGVPLVSYLRYNVDLDQTWCRDQLGLDLTQDDIDGLAKMDDPDQMPQLDAIGRTAGAALVHDAHFPAAFDQEVRVR